MLRHPSQPFSTFVGYRDYFGVYYHFGLRFRGIGIARACGSGDYEDAERLGYLRSGDSDAACFGGRENHVVNQFLDF